MIRFRLRYGGTELELKQGVFVIGRSPACDLSLEDALMSRRHAILHVGESEVELEDLGSRNGVRVNGQRLQGRAPLKPGDVVGIGSKEVRLITTDARMASPHAGRSTLGAALRASSDTRESGSVVEQLAEKALALGHYREAERILSRKLQGTLQLARQEGHMDDPVLRQASAYALALATGLEDSKWLEWLFELYAALGHAPDQATLDALHAAVRQLPYAGGPGLRACIAALRARHSSLAPGERFCLSRLEGLQRMLRP